MSCPAADGSCIAPRSLVVSLTLSNLSVVAVPGEIVISWDGTGNIGDKVGIYFRDDASDIDKIIVSKSDAAYTLTGIVNDVMYRIWLRVETDTAYGIWYPYAISGFITEKFAFTDGFSTGFQI